MTSKEALERYYSNLKYGCGGFQNDNEELEGLNAIKQDLDRLEQLEDNIKIHKETIKMQHDQIENLEKVIDILKGRICVHQRYICYDGYADVELTDEEIKLVKEYLNE